VNANGYKLFRYVAWQGGKWYLRRKLPSRRTVAVAGLAAFSLLLAATLIGRRLASSPAE